MMMLLLVALTSASYGKTKVVIFTTQPQMHCAGCELKVKGLLQDEAGVKEITTSVADQTVTVKFNNKKTSADQLRQRLEASGYEVRKLAKGERVSKEANKCNYQGGCGE